MIELKKFLFALLNLLLLISYGQEFAYESNELKIRQLSTSTYQCISYLNTEKWGKVACNSMIVISNGESALFDTPNTNEVSEELISWLQDSMKTEIKWVVVNHHHIDCLGGLDAFKKIGVPSVSSSITQRLAEKNGESVPDEGFDDHFSISVGDVSIENVFLGPAHAQGTIFSYLSQEEVLFGGCSVKSLKAGKGNLGDADVDSWPKVITKVSEAYPNVKIVIPGHGSPGGKELLEYTMEIFK